MTQNYKFVEELEAIGCDREPFTPDHAKCQCRTTSKAASLIQELGEALEPFAKMHVIEPSGLIVGLERFDFERARSALSKLKEA